ncbi:unnamed protein product [Adineta steineri]|uniref:Uncharacterized protein n=1 Tax=Adineta steineri TaxID=433720 RepID=A0A819FCW9_9BILA|nr:unnamed protein product [Adineta steineri]CAF3862630.1 unnamed protein product [Adineta steineri]
MIKTRYSTDTCEVVLRLNNTNQNQVQHLTWHYEMLQKYVDDDNNEQEKSKLEFENASHLLASMYLSIRRANQNYTQKLPYINNHTFTKFVEKFIKRVNEKSSNVYENHCDVQRLLEQIQYQHETSIK